MGVWRRFVVAVMLGLLTGITARAQQPSPTATLTGMPATEPLPTPAAAEYPPVDLKPTWKNGLTFVTPDKSFTVNVGGRVHFDTANYITPQTLRKSVLGTNRLDDGVSFRRVRIDISGTMYEHVDYYMQIDFVTGVLLETGTNRTADEPSITDLWLTFRDLPLVGNLRVGNQKSPIGFDHLISARFLSFMERSLGFDAFIENFSNGYVPGVSIFDTYAQKRGTWAFGVFKNTRSVLLWNVGQYELEVDGRLTGLPIDEDGGKRLVHLGLGVSSRQPDENQQRFRGRFDVRNSPSALSPLLIDTGLVTSSRQYLMVPEFAAVFGPLSLQAEFYGSWLTDATTTVNKRSVPQGTIFYSSAYIEAHYFLTGEHREYDHERAVFTRVTPRTPARWSRAGMEGWGAWEVALRLQYLDLQSGNVEGGLVHDMTLGVNWYLNPNVKVQWNYSLADRALSGTTNTAGNGIVHAFGTRLAWEF